MIWPTQDAQARPAVRLRLRSPSGDALLEAPADAVAGFLAATTRLVPPGTEHQHFDIDAALESLLGNPIASLSRSPSDYRRRHPCRTVPNEVSA